MVHDVFCFPAHANFNHIFSLWTIPQVLFCSTDVGRTSFVRQLEADWHIDSNLEIISQLLVSSSHQYLYSMFTKDLARVANIWMNQFQTAIYQIPTLYLGNGIRTNSAKCIHIYVFGTVLFLAWKNCRRQPRLAPCLWLWSCVPL